MTSIRVFILKQFAGLVISLVAFASAQAQDIADVYPETPTMGPVTSVTQVLTINSKTSRYCQNPGRLGDTCLMNWASASLFCSSISRQLPSPRDFATYAWSLGAQGVRETKYPLSPLFRKVEKEMERYSEQGFHAVFATAKTGDQSIDFYYSQTFFVERPGQASKKFIWSKTTFPTDLNTATAEDFGRVYAFSEPDGELVALPRERLAAVHCN